MMRPLKTLILFLPLVVLQDDSWQDPWITLTTDCQENDKCDLTLGGSSGQLVIPESSVFSEVYSTVLAEVQFTSDKEMFITCQDCANREDWLLSENLDIVEKANGMKRALVKMRGKLDFENPSSPNFLSPQRFFFMLGTENHGACTPNTCKDIYVTLKNVVDEKPEFIGDWGNTMFNLPELTEGKDQDGVVTIEGQDNEIEKTDLDLTLSNDFSVFSVTRIEGNSWALNVAKLDYDLGRKSYSLELNLERASDTYGLTTIATTTLFANVIDTSDQIPLWERQCGYIELPEEEEVGTQTFFTIKAVDQDTGSCCNSSINYALVEDDGNDQQWFKLEKDEASGNVAVVNSQRIDREAIQEATQGMLEFKVEATEDDTASMSSETTCRVRIVDIDDNVPKFKDANTESEVAFHAWVREDNPIGSPFEFCQENGFTNGACPQANVVNPVAYDDDQYDLSYNDFTLTISSDSFVDAVDKFGVTPSRIIGSLNFFVSSQVLDNSLLDYETQAEVDFTITATPQKGGTTTSTPVKIHIIDINDCTPAFTQEKYTVTIDETVTDQELPVQIDSTDDDTSDQFGRPGHIYSIVKDSTLAQNLIIDNTTGAISVGNVRLFDFEEAESHTIKVQVHDCRACSGTNVMPRMAEAVVEILLNNVNDENPVITNSQDCNIEYLRNDIQVGEQIVKLNGQDNDGNTFVMTIIKSSDPTIQAYFELAENGSLTLARALNEENAEVEDPNFTFTVQIEDNNENPSGSEKLRSTADCSFKIIDINSQRPEFTFPVPNNESARTWIDEGSQVSANLVNMANGQEIEIHAIDSDVNANNKRVSYKWNPIINPVYEEYFKLDSTFGTIKLLRALADFPFEPDTDTDHPNMISLPILAEDQGTPSQMTSLPATLRLKSFKNIEPEFNIVDRQVRREREETDMGGNFPAIELPFAVDPNNLNPPPTADWTPQAIYYQITGPALFPGLFVIDDPLQNKVTLNGTLDVDCDFCPKSYNFRVSASNTAGVPNFEKPFSVQNVTVEILDINDNVPAFVGLPSYFVLESVSNCDDCQIEADDKDTVLDKQLNFTIISTNASDESLNGLSFDIVSISELATRIARLSPDFAVSDGMTGFFDLGVQVSDQGGHDSSTHVKVVVMTAQNNVTFGFVNSAYDVCRQRDAIIKIFLEVLGWSFTEKGREPCGTESQASPRENSFSEFEGYFVDPDTFEPKSQREIAAQYDLQFEKLWVALNHQLNISLDAHRGFQGETSVQGSLVGTSFALMIVGIICASFVVATAVFLLVAYCVRTKALERRVKALDTDAVEGVGDGTEAPKKQTDKIFLSGLADAVPGSNEFADQGANPIWKEAMESNDFEEDFKFEDDAMSESSGDSILIGVEDQTEFNDYTEKMKEIDVDMDLYSKLQGNRYKTLDEYQGPDEGFPGSSGGRNPLYDDEDDA